MEHDAGCVLYEADPARCVVVAWHGRGPNEGFVLRPLAQALQRLGATVLVPDWDSTSADRGAGVLRHSLACAEQRRADLPLVLVGWSHGGTAALSVALGLADVPARPAAVVGLAAGVRGTSPLGGGVPLDALTSGSVQTLLPCVLVHGTADEIVRREPAHLFVAAASAVGARVRHREVDTDHAGVIGTSYDQTAQHCVPSHGERAARGLAAATAAVAEALELARPEAADG